MLRADNQHVRPLRDATNRPSPLHNLEKPIDKNSGGTRRTGSARGLQNKRLPSVMDKSTTRIRKFYVGDVAIKSKNIASERERHGRRVPVPTRWPTLSRLIRSKNASQDDSDSGSDSDSSSEDDSDDDGHAVAFILSHRFSPPFPSPLSPYSLIQHCNRSTPPRLLYPHRGHSRSSLMHQKTFWQERYEEWILWQTETHSELAYEESATRRADGEGTTFASLGPPPRGSPIIDARKEEIPNLSDAVYNLAMIPRVGDLAALRDPMSVVADHELMDVPLCTLAKMSWLFDACFRSYSADTRNRALELAASEPLVSPDAKLNLDYGTAKPNDLNFKQTVELSPCSRSPTHAGASDESCSSEGDITLVNERLKESASLPSLYSSKSFEYASCFPYPPISKNSIFAPYDHSGPHLWEVCWQIRSEILKSEVKSAQSQDSISGFKNEPRRSLHFLPSTNYGHCLPECFVPVRESASGSLFMSEDERAVTFARILPADEEEDDYGEVVDNPTFRVGASLNPYTMFEHLDESPVSICCVDVVQCPSGRPREVNVKLASLETTLMLISDDNGDIENTHGEKEADVVSQRSTYTSSHNPFLEAKSSENWADFEDVSLGDDSSSSCSTIAVYSSSLSCASMMSVAKAGEIFAGEEKADESVGSKTELKVVPIVRVPRDGVTGIGLIDIGEGDVWSAD